MKNKETVTIDDVDKEILRIINQDARTPYRQISRDLDISVGTVHNRIDKLVKTGVIKKFTTIIDHSKLGYNLTVIIGLRVKGGRTESLENKVEYSKNVIGIYDITGKYDATMIAKFRDTDELNQFIKMLLKEPTIERTYTQTVLKITKEDTGFFDIF
ncbi:MAG: Lrp/AsnC family transcriptional regulator [Methanobrevibacter sp. CfCl-M3]